ncbi:MPN555 family protein chaperone [Mycoplasmoides alvi]|uniref:MPN555 family protein chaperone n=1 Tax=Mycoplasmoides alvi TaxID=78580 RepID=UPI000698D265|nr:hypothetical protein [Mycoplasmoides alvi]
MDKNKNNESKIVENKSTSELVTEINFSKEIRITRIFTDGNLISQHKERLRKGIKNISEQVLDFETVQMVIKDNLFSAAMEEIVSHFKFNIDSEYRNFIEENVKHSLMQPSGKEPEARVVTEISEKIIKKGLVFNYLEKLWKIEVSDQEIKDMLDIYYQKTNESIRDVLEDKERFEGIRKAILEEKLIIKTISAFPIRFDLQIPVPVSSSDSSNSSSFDNNKKN